jgi:hypothetical protein
MAQTTANRRLLQEYRALTSNPPEGITAGPVSEDDLLYWEAWIQGPEGTPFEGGVFPAELRFPKDYPLAPPTMKFVGGEVWHPNGGSILSSATGSFGGFAFVTWLCVRVRAREREREREGGRTDDRRQSIQAA